MTARFDPDAHDRAGATAYLRERACQALIDGFVAVGPPEPLVEDGVEWGVRGLARSPEGVVHQTVYVLAGHRGRGRMSALLSRREFPVVTIPDCDIERYLERKGVPFVVVAKIITSPEYRAIAAHYGAGRARRSGVPLMRHIDEGLAVLGGLGASGPTMRAFCLHPLVQEDAALAAAFPRIGELTPEPSILALALEYRNIANATLSTRAIAGPEDIPLSPLADVNLMLVADKIQNRKDFLRHHRATHPRAAPLDRYFRIWLERLGVSEETFEHWRERLTIAG